VTGVTAEHSFGTYSWYVDIKRTILALATVLGGASLTLPGATPAAATSPLFPVDCQTNNVVLDQDNATYELSGTCGVVTVTGDNVTVTDLPATRTLIVKGQGDHISGKPVDLVVLHGRDSQVSVRSIRVARVDSPGSTLRVTGLLEVARIPGNHSRVHSDRLTKVFVEGNRNLVRSDRGETTVHNDGHHNRIRVAKQA
jgi:hypothetical protein